MTEATKNSTDTPKRLYSQLMMCSVEPWHGEKLVAIVFSVCSLLMSLSHQTYTDI